jgi:5-methylcytosine-specific restriction endonuclease McrA
MNTLVLTPWMSPLMVVPWQAAVTMMFLDKVDVIENYDETIRSPSVTIPMPAVVRLRRPVQDTKKGVKFSRTNLMTRDNYTCQYCGARLPMAKLNYDHVIPRRMGGKTVWENIVTACYPCNARKADRTPEMAGMRLRRKPFRPRSLPVSTVVLTNRQLPTAWVPYVPTALEAGN